MPSASLVKPTHKAIVAYYQTLQAYGEHEVEHETALRSAFQYLLAETAKAHHWMLVPEQPTRVGGKLVRPDGTLCDEYNLHRGYWEAKDTDDNLDAEISKKIAKGYPLTNTIFEDTRQAVLFQGKREVRRTDLTNPQNLADLLNHFYAYTEPEHEDFEQAVEEFKDRVPDLARGLADKINAAHQGNPKFQTAFDSFFSLCQTALNPNISQAAVDEMLVQHLLTERLIRKIFDNPEFTQRNVIAAEVEKVIAALGSKGFNRDDFQKSLDRFYLAIENAARTMPEFSDKQHFLNTVYERFFQGYSVKLADTHGIVYTPQPIVDFMCASVAEVLQTEFGKSLGDKDVNILDPCTGTGNFIVNLLRRIPKKDLPRMYREQLFANEVMLLPYYIAALNIEHAYYELTGNYEPFEGLCFVDTLDMAEEKGLLSFMTEKNTERVERQRRTPITVIIGNPPYNVGQLDENDNNKNRVYLHVDKRIRETYSKDSSATLKMQIYDPYVKFIRWATDRLAGHDGIICVVTNNSFVHKDMFDGMRKHLLADFSLIHHLDLRGDVKMDPHLSGTAYNVFGIQVGVGITIAVRNSRQTPHAAFIKQVDKLLPRQDKLLWLNQHESVSTVGWKNVSPDARQRWFELEHADDFEALIPMGSKAAKGAKSGVVQTVFKTFSGGLKSNRDDVVYDFNYDLLARATERFCEAYNSEVDRLKRKGKASDIDEFLDSESVQWSSTLKEHVKRGNYASFADGKISKALYRPFTSKFVYHDDILIDRPGLLRSFFPTLMASDENLLICCTDEPQIDFSALIARTLPCYHLGGRQGQCFPFYVYDEDGSNRRENITDWALEQFRGIYDDKKISKWAIFYYLYGVLHHPGYRDKFADNLKRGLPRIPFAPDFRAFETAGEELSRLHLDYEKLEPYPLKWVEAPGEPLSYRVEDKMRLSKEKTTLVVNPSLTLGGIPPETFQYRLGNRSALEWVIDQYQVSEDKRSGIKSDPNRSDDEEYIVRLVGQVIQVSVKTVEIVGSLPKTFTS